MGSIHTQIEAEEWPRASLEFFWVFWGAMRSDALCCFLFRIGGQEAEERLARHRMHFHVRSRAPNSLCSYVLGEYLPNTQPVNRNPYPQQEVLARRRVRAMEIALGIYDLPPQQAMAKVDLEILQVRNSRTYITPQVLG